MSLRPTRQRRQHGPDAIYSQLADNYDHTAKRRAEPRGIYPFGRADPGDPEAWRRLAQSILRVVHDAQIERAARPVPPEVGLDDSEQVSA